MLATLGHVHAHSDSHSAGKGGSRGHNEGRIAGRSKGGVVLLLGLSLVLLIGSNLLLALILLQSLGLGGLSGKESVDSGVLGDRSREVKLLEGLLGRRPADKVEAVDGRISGLSNSLTVLDLNRSGGTINVEIDLVGLDSRRLVLGPLGVERHVVAAALDGLAEVDRVVTVAVVGPAGEGPDTTPLMVSSATPMMLCIVGIRN